MSKVIIVCLECDRAIVVPEGSDIWDLIHARDCSKQQAFIMKPVVVPQANPE